MTATNLLDILSQQEVQEGFDADCREDLLRSFVVSNYRYHQQEIMLAITAEYTDWSRSLHQPISIRDSTGQGLHDANIVSPMTDLAKQLYNDFSIILSLRVGGRRFRFWKGQSSPEGAGIRLWRSSGRSWTFGLKL
ncbi:neuroligin-1-like [Palaemon carinicauda]|uniref:neuroligin-1-like n=1 Tax=Palaemon carinicauda TaxID=392227 RepID=UPI0035B663DE